jgi:hypothetical protein
VDQITWKTTCIRCWMFVFRTTFQRSGIEKHRGISHFLNVCISIA